jgi:hypothetical protein
MRSSAEQGYWTGTVRWTVPDANASLDENEPIVSFNTIGGSGHINTARRRSRGDARGRVRRGPRLPPGDRRFVGRRRGRNRDHRPDLRVGRDARSQREHGGPQLPPRALPGSPGRSASRLPDFAQARHSSWGRRASQRGRGNARPWEINFRFAGSANVEAIKVDGVGPVNKDGWDYLWVYYVQEESAGDTSPRSPVSSSSASTTASHGISCPEAPARARTSSTPSAHEQHQPATTTRARPTPRSSRSRRGRPPHGGRRAAGARARSATTPSRTTSEARASPRGTGTSSATSSRAAASGCATAPSRASSRRRPSACAPPDGRPRPPVHRTFAPASSFPDGNHGYNYFIGIAATLAVAQVIASPLPTSRSATSSR